MEETPTKIKREENEIDAKKLHSMPSLPLYLILPYLIFLVTSVRNLHHRYSIIITISFPGAGATPFLDLLPRTHPPASPARYLRVWFPSLRWRVSRRSWVIVEGRRRHHCRALGSRTAARLRLRIRAVRTAGGP